MCLIVSKNRLEVKVAEKNILCYKRLFSTGESEHKFFQYVRDVKVEEPGAAEESSPYDQDYHYRVNVSGIPGSEFVEFGRGFHSWIGKNRPANSLFIIPKGTKYVTGSVNHCASNDEDHDGYLSEAIIYIGKKNLFNRIKAFLFYGVSFK